MSHYSGGRRTLAAAACAVALAVDMIEMALGSAFSTVFVAPPYRMQAGALSLLLASVYLGAVCGAPLVGWLSGRLGIRRCLVMSLGWVGVMSLLSAATPGMAWLGVLRFLAGLALGAIPPLLIAYLTQMAPPARRGSFVFWVCGLAALAPPIALMLIRWLLPLAPLGVESWRWLLAGTGVVSLLAAWPFRHLPEAHAWQPGAVDVAEAVVPGTAAENAARPGVSRRLVLMSAVYFLLPWASVGMPLITGPIMVARGFDVRQALVYVALTTLGPTLASLITGSIVDRFDRRSVLVTCAVAMGVSVLTFAMSHSVMLVGGALVMFGIAAAIYVTALTLYAAEIFPVRIMTFATSVAWACNRGAAVLVPVMLFTVVGTRDSVMSVLPIIIAIAVSLVLVCLGPPSPNGRAIR